MYTEGFDELSEAENRPPRTYVSASSQDAGKLQREVERLKKSLEKEQFFNRLLDQELKDLKSSREGGSSYDPELYRRTNGVSRGAFNTLLVITIALAGFIAYTLLYNKQYDLFPQAVPTTEIKPVDPAPAVTDSVPNIISGKKATTPPVQQQPSAKQQDAVVVPEKTVTNKDLKAKPKVAEIEQTEAATTTQTQAPEQQVAQPETTTAQQPVAAPPVEKPVIGKYVVTSKANFYSAPDENTLRSYFISPGSDKVVNALEDKNGFIYVEFKNDVGYVTKGWLSKADLARQ